MVAQDSSPADSVANDSSLVSNLGAEARGSSALEPGSRAWLVSGILFLVLLLGMVGVHGGPPSEEPPAGSQSTHSSEEAG